MEELLQIFRTCRTWRRGRTREDHLVSAKIHLVNHLRDVLVRAATEDAHHAVVRNMRANATHQRIHCRWVVGAVTENARTVRNHFHAPRDLGGRKSGRQLVLRQLKSEVLQHINRSKRKSAVAGLMLALQRHRHMLKTTVLGVHAHARVRSKVRGNAESAGELNILVDNPKFSANRLCHFAHHRINFGILFEEQRRDTLLKDARLLASNQRLGSAQQFGVIKINRSHNADQRRDDVG